MQSTDKIAVADEVVQFEDVIHAFQWAEEILSRPMIESQFAKFLKIRGDGATMDELRDQAMTILSVVQRIEPHEISLAFRYCYGFREDATLAQDLYGKVMQVLHREAPHIKSQNAARMTQLVLTVIKGYRQLKRYNHQQGMIRIARDLGITRHYFYSNGWPQFVFVTRSIMERMVENAERWIGDELKDKGFIGGGVL